MIPRLRDLLTLGLLVAMTALAMTALVRVDAARAQDAPAAPAAAAAQAAPADSAARADSAAAASQRDVTDVLRDILNRPVKSEVSYEPRPGLSMTLLPSIGYNPAYGGYIGASVALAGWLGDPKTTLLSSGTIGGSYSTSQRISIQFKSDFFLPDNQWAHKGDWRYLDTSQETFGLGPDESGQTPYPMDFVLYRLYQTVYRRVSVSSVYVGIGYHFDLYDKILDERAEAGETTPFSVYSGGTPSRTQS